MLQKLDLAMRRAGLSRERRFPFPHTGTALTRRSTKTLASSTIHQIMSLPSKERHF